MKSHTQPFQLVILRHLLLDPRPVILLRRMCRRLTVKRCLDCAGQTSENSGEIILLSPKVCGSIKYFSCHSPIEYLQHQSSREG